MLNVVVASSADMAKEILHKNDQAFIGRPTPESVAVGKFKDMSLVWSSGLNPHWKKSSENLQHSAFHKSKNGLTARIEASDDLFDMKSDGIRELKELIGDLMELALKANVADFVPFLRPFDPQGIKRRITVLFDRLHKLLDDIMGQRVRRRTSGQSDRCGISWMFCLISAKSMAPKNLTTKISRSCSR
ncbi:UNVERIFIED_CONTAM: Ferruginol synthase [Sesamum angustifolium]|uniref:Ferruginol synthase n=1 Tax=Sesamum angustifolium TaxID=2727405 RepID=A0AAW2IJ38_9LAMI